MSGDPARATAGVREHLAVGREHSLRSLESYFRAEETTGRRFSRQGTSLLADEFTVASTAP